MNNKEDSRDMLLARYNHLNDEITRYRDLVWKVVSSSWAMYGAIIWFFIGDKKILEQIQSNAVPPLFYILLFVVAIVTTISHIFCEISVWCCKRQRNSIARHLNLTDARWLHDEPSSASSFWRLAISASLFLLITLFPLILINSFNYFK